LVDDERAVTVDVDIGRDELVVWDSDTEAVGQDKGYVAVVSR
jgi:hypothetical protein